MIPIVGALLQNGLSLLGNAVLAKGKDWVEQKTGVKLGDNIPPEQVAQLKQAEMEHEEELLKIKLEENKLNLQELELHFKNTDSARNREVTIATSKDAPLLNKIVTPVLALGITLLTFAMFGAIMFDKAPVDPSRKDILIYVLGFLSAVASQVASYYFGSSAGSKEKDAALKEALK